MAGPDPAGLDVTTPNIARMYDYMLGGTDNYTVDREVMNGEVAFILDWDDIRDGPDPHSSALDFARSAALHACAICRWDPGLAASIEGTPPPLV